MNTCSLDEITIRTHLNAGDIGYITFLHGTLYKEEYNYGIAFESYVASGLHDFYQQYDARTNRVWICEHHGKIIGSLFLMNRGKAAQLRYFIIIPDYRGIGLGNKLMRLFMEFIHHCEYESAYLWTTAELYAAAHLYKKFGFQLAEEKESQAFEKPVRENKYVVYFK